MTARTKKIIAYVALGVLVVGIGIGVYFLFIHESDPSWRIRHINAQDIVNHRNYSESRMYIHSNGTFEVEIIETIGEVHVIVFTGIGTYTSTRNSYTFTFSDSYTNAERTNGARQLDKGETRPPFAVERGRIQFDAHWGISYHFGR
jgi:hypothetical protein